MIHWLLAYFQEKVQSNNYHVRCLAPWTRVIRGFSHISLFFFFFFYLYIYTSSPIESLCLIYKRDYLQGRPERVYYLYLCFMFSCLIVFDSFISCPCYLLGHVIFICHLMCVYLSVQSVMSQCLFISWHVSISYFFSPGLRVCHFLFPFDSPTSHVYYGCVPMMQPHASEYAHFSY